ncbi:hypothetical protein F4777DRAFT_565182 [Nemania sp. FL0916]|nr:hypothetical protein F4777DRAFT_565182 [Nemania sp. FL0916]
MSSSVFLLLPFIHTAVYTRTPLLLNDCLARFELPHCLLSLYSSLFTLSSTSKPLPAVLGFFVLPPVNQQRGFSCF